MTIVKKELRQADYFSQQRKLLTLSAYISPLDQYSIYVQWYM